MNTLVLPRPVENGRRLLELGVELFAGVRDGLHMIRHYNALNSLSDAELTRRGLKREDIARTVVQAVG